MESGWRIRIRDISRTRILAKTDLLGFLPSCNMRRTLMVCTTWLEMSGSGRAIGIVLTTISSLRPLEGWHETRKDLIPPTILVSQRKEKKRTAEDRICARNSIVRATSLGREAKVKSAQERIIWDFDV